jgi:predicted branched-subunit amino acid permease|tara:strand:- start:185 stop:889 length:705 start_codon:yes stop_codon:yes gene_type:complete
MINKKFFFKGFKSILTYDSPAIALGCCFIAIGALLKNLGFNFQETVFSTMLTYALPGSLVMAESLLIGASLLNIFLAVWFVNARLYPMAVSLFPLMMHKNQPKWKYYFSCHFIAVSAWLIMKSNYEKIEKEHRIDFWIGIGSATWSVAVLGTICGFYFSEYLNKEMMMGLAVVNPIYFLCMMVGASKTLEITLSVLLGLSLGPIFYFLSPEWSVLLGGLVGGSVAYLIGELNVS